MPNSSPNASLTLSIDPPEGMELPITVLECIAFHLQALDEHRETDESALVAFSCVSRGFAEVARRTLLRSVYLAPEGDDARPYEYFATKVAPQFGAHIRELYVTNGRQDSKEEDEEEEVDEEEVWEIVEQRQQAVSAALPHLVNLELLALDVGEALLPAEEDPLFVAAQTLAISTLRLLPLYINSEDDVEIDPAYLAAALPLFSCSLRSLDITGVGNFGREVMGEFVDALQSLCGLKELALRDCDIGPTITHGGWASKLTSLTIHRCTRLDLVDLEDLINHHFSSSLTTLNLHHYTPMDGDSHALFDLPNLTSLEFESTFPIRHLERCFSACKAIKHLRVGSALHPWRNEEEEGAGWKSAMANWELESLTMLEGERCWGMELIESLRDWAEGSEVLFEVEEQSDYSEDVSSEWSSSEEGEGM